MKEIESVIKSVKEIFGIELTLCDYFTGIRTLDSTGEIYFNIVLDERISHSSKEFNFLNKLVKYGIINRFDQNGLKRVALFI